MFVNPVVSECVSKTDTLVVDTGNSVGAFDSQTARNGALFLCPVGDEVGDELAELVAVGSAGDRKIASIRVSGHV